MQCIAKARENARTIRDRISREMWEDINGLYFNVSRFNPQEEIAAGPHRFCDEIKFGSHRFHGVTDATLPHDEGWEFLRIGWSLERAEMTARLVDVQYHNLLDAHSSRRSAGQSPVDGRAAIRGRLRGLPPPVSFARSKPEKVAEMLILHPQHPRSIRFSISEVQAGLRAISRHRPPALTPTKPNASRGKLLESLRYDTHRAKFSSTVFTHTSSELLRICGAIGEDIARTYFYYAVVA